MSELRMEAAESCRELYLDLMKKTLTFLLWPEPAVPLTWRDESRPFLKRQTIRAIATFLGWFDLELRRTKPVDMSQRQEGRIWPQYAHTMVGMKRLDHLQSCIETVLSENVPGDLIETGAWRGGASIFMRAVLKAYEVRERTVYVADSFSGLPPPDAAKYASDIGDRHYAQTLLAVPQDQVEENFRRYGLLDEKVVFLPGWFKDTLPSAPIETLSILRLDGDMYGSTFEVLEQLYPRLQSGGFCIIDDYALEGCRLAVDDYRKQHGIASPLREIDWTGRFWRK